MTPAEKRAINRKINAELKKADWETVKLVFFALCNKTRFR